MVRYPIIENREIRPKYFRITLDISGDTHIPRPGQFYNVRCGEGTDPLVRRPLSVHRVIIREDSVYLEILYQVVGKGTQWLSRRQKGEFLDVLGPFGNWFIINDSITDVVLVAGGIGIAPLYALGQNVRASNVDSTITIVMGARRKSEIFYEEECSNIGEVFVSTDDGSYGFRGTANDLLLYLLEHKKISKRCSFYACGPALMLKELAAISEKFGLSCQVTLEEHMGCGFGACLSCAIPLRPDSIKRSDQWQKPALQWSEGEEMVYSLVCKDGPVYDIKEVYWDEWLA